jgi:hypothetical protein
MIGGNKISISFVGTRREIHKGKLQNYENDEKITVN